MSAPLRWEDNPARKYFDICLALYWNYSLVMHKSYQYKSFGPKERAHLRTELEKLPDSPLRELLLSILKVVQAPTGSFKLKNFKLKEYGDKVIHTHEIMADPHVFFRVAGLSWLNVKSVEIFTNLRHHSIKMIYGRRLRGSCYIKAVCGTKCGICCAHHRNIIRQFINTYVCIITAIDSAI